MRKLILYLLIFFLSSCSRNDECSSNDSMLTSSRSIERVYTFPSVDEILSNETVRLAMEAAWGQMKMQIINNAGRREYGFYIYYDHDTGNFYVGPTTMGTIEMGCGGTSASVHLGVVSNNIDVCAFFHCHTSLQGCPNGTYRSTGPSNADYNYAERHKLPGILYDYSESTISPPTHTVHSSYQAYVFGPYSRPSIHVTE